MRSTMALRWSAAESRLPLRAAASVWVSPCLPDPAGGLVHHGRILTAGEGLLKLRHVGERPIHAESPERVRIRDHLRARRLGADILAPTERKREKEALPRRESVGFRRVERFALRLIYILER